MNRVQPRTLSGFMELLPKEQIQFNRMVDILKETYELYGFTPLDTPAIEASEVLLAKGGGETEKQIYRFNRGDTDLSLRFDLTVPLAKYVAMHQGTLNFPFRRYQIGKVYRGERPQRGRFREFYQADIDIVGNESLGVMCDAEMPSIISKAFTKMGLKRFVIRVNNRKILNGFYKMEGLTAKSSEIMRIVDKIDKVGREQVRQLLEEIGVENPNHILDFMQITGKNEEVFQSLESYLGKDELFDLGVEELKTVTRHLKALGVPEEQFKVDLTIARGLDYYTGTVYETSLLDHPEIGSICSGGRYDNLADYYTNKKLPGVGISIGLTRLFFVLQDQGYLNSEMSVAPCDVLVLPMTEDFAPSVEIATAFREEGIRTQLYSEDKKFKQKISYADKIAVGFVAILGEDEIQQGKVTIKNMITGTQEVLPKEEAVAFVKNSLVEHSKATPIRDKE